MKSLFLKIAPILAFTACAYSAAAQIVNQVTDADYHYTTVVYVQKNTAGSQVLQAVDNDFGLGDVVRIAEAQSVQTSAQIPPIPINVATARLNVAPAEPAKSQVAPRQKAPVSALPNKTAPTTLTVAETPTPIATRPAAAPKKAPAAKSKSTSAKKKKCYDHAPFKAPVTRRKGGKQKYGCPKF
jgi:hypothetical protein